MRFLAVMLALLAGAGPCWAQADCGDLPAFAENFIASAGIRSIRNETWFLDCVAPEARDAPAWPILESYAIDANRFGQHVRAITESGSTLRMDTDGATLAVRLYRNGSSQIVDIETPQVAIAGKPVSAIVELIGALPGKVTVLVEEDGQEIAGRDPDRPLQVSSSMKLGILRALLDEVEAGSLKLQSNALVRPDLKALPSGTLHQFFDYAPVTLHTLASLMMRDSDNTAADILIDTVGKERIAAVLGLPYLMTYHQWFMLKGDSAKYAEFEARGETGRKAYLDAMLPAVPLNYSDSVGGVTPEAGWHLSNRKLCALARGVAASPFAQLEAAVLQYDEWRTVVSKGGGDQTLRNDTLLVTRFDGKTYCVSTTWNPATAITDDSRYSFFVTSLLEAVRRR